jgi:fructose-1,6-bisphosphatase/inositol monophosphatase family enzyme
MRAKLEKISQLVRDAVVALPAPFDRGRDIGMGADGTPTSAIDKVAEDVILQAVEDMDLPVNVLSEEAGLVDRGMPKTLVIDPIDGTHNSIMGLPLYTVSLAVGTRSLNDIEVGVIRNLVTGDLFHAEKGKGAYLNGKKIQVRKYSPPVLASLIYIGHTASPRTLDVIKRSSRTRALGCATLEMCLVAQGTFDAYYMNSEVPMKSIRVVDIAASVLILREAGGGIVDLAGHRLDMSLDLAARSNFLAYGDSMVKEAIL